MEGHAVCFPITAGENAIGVALDKTGVSKLPGVGYSIRWFLFSDITDYPTRILAYSKWLNKGLPLRLRERRQVGCELYERMYTAYAE